MSVKAKKRMHAVMRDRQKTRNRMRPRLSFGAMLGAASLHFPGPIVRRTEPLSVEELDAFFADEIRAQPLGSK